jgi:hypothetical protein
MKRVRLTHSRVTNLAFHVGHHNGSAMLGRFLFLLPRAEIGHWGSASGKEASSQLGIVE